MVKGIGKVAWEEAKCFFLNSKLILIVFELLFFCETFLVQVRELSVLSGMRLSFFEPYLLLSSKSMYFLAIPLVYLILLSGFPSKHSYNYFSLIRITRLQWLLGEVLFLVVSAIGYLLVLGVGITVYLGKYIQLDNQWSGYMLQFRERFPEVFSVSDEYFLDAEMMIHGSPMSVFWHSVFLMMLMLVCVALIQLTFSLCQKRYFGMLMTVGLTLASALFFYSAGAIKWIFPMTHTNYGAHFNGIRAQENMGLGMSYLYFGLICLLFLATAFVLVKKTDMEV